MSHVLWHSICIYWPCCSSYTDCADQIATYLAFDSKFCYGLLHVPHFSSSTAACWSNGGSIPTGRCGIDSMALTPTQLSYAVLYVASTFGKQRRSREFSCCSSSGRCRRSMFSTYFLLPNSVRTPFSRRLNCGSLRLGVAC